MEELVGLLVAVAAIAFKLIGNRLEKSGQSGKSSKMREFAEALEGEDSPMHDWEYFGKALLGDDQEETPVNAPVEKPAPVAEVKPAPRPREISTFAKSAKPRKELLENTAPQKDKERIDPRKLMIYSEIMKPKFKE